MSAGGTDPKTIPVFGNQRGGTSAAAGVLRILGVPMGADVRDGNNEDLRMQSAVRHGGPEGVKQVVEEYDARWDVWGWKFPRSISRYGWIEPLLRNPTPVCVHRPTSEIVASVKKYRGSIRDMQALLNRIQKHTERFSQLTGLHIEYHDLLENTETTVSRIADYVGVEVSDWPRIKTYIRPGYRRLDGSLVTDEDMTPNG